MDVQAIEQGIKDGLSVSDIARALDCSTMQVYRAAFRAGLPICRGRVTQPITLRAAVQDMKPSDALEFVLEAYEMLTGQKQAPQRIFGAVNLTQQQATIFAMLRKSAGVPVSRERISAVLSAAGSIEGVSDGCIKVQVTRLRKKLEGRCVIKTVWGMGYVLEGFTGEGVTNV